MGERMCMLPYLGAVCIYLKQGYAVKCFNSIGENFSLLLICIVIDPLHGINVDLWRISSEMARGWQQTNEGFFFWFL